VEHDSRREVMTPEESADFCISKCGCGYCLYMTSVDKKGLGFPCIEYICASCKLTEEKCNFCKGVE